MGVVSHGYGGLSGAWMEVVDGMNAGQSLDSISGDAGAISEYELIE